MSVHIRIPLKENEKRRLEQIQNGIYEDEYKDDNTPCVDWDEHELAINHLIHPFLNVRLLYMATHNEISFYRSSLKYLFSSMDDYLCQAGEYREALGLKPIHLLTKEDVVRYDIYASQEKSKIYKRLSNSEKR